MSSRDDSDSDRGMVNMSWITTGIFTIAAMMGLWWAEVQQDSIRQLAAENREQPVLQWSIWSLTIVIVGLCIGLAVASGSGWRRRIRASALMWAAVPLAIVVAFQLFLARPELIDFPVGFLEILVGVQVQVASAVAVGVFLSGLLAPLLPGPRSS